MKRRIAVRPDRILSRVSLLGVAALLAHTVGAEPILTGPIQAAADNRFSLTVSDTEFYDSNLFKLPKDLNADFLIVTPIGSRSDEFNTATIGADGQRVLGRQTFDVTGHLDETRFAHNSQLNNTGGDGRFLWNWEAGPYLTGQASAAYYRALAGFNETRYAGKDLVTTVSYFLAARYQIGPHWAIIADGHFDNTTHDAPLVYYNNFRDQLLSGGIEYALTPDDTFSLVYHHFDGRYPRPLLEAGVPIDFDRNYHEDFPQFYVHYAFGDKTLFDANIGHIKRSYDNVNIGEYTGFIYRAGVDYQLTDKLDFSVRGWHELHAYSSNESDYFIGKGVSFGPRWAPTEKLKVSANFSSENDDYLPGSFSEEFFVNRHDKQTYEQVDVLYQPRYKWNINLFIRHFERISNQSQVGYDDQFANISVSYTFF